MSRNQSIHMLILLSVFCSSLIHFIITFFYNVKKGNNSINLIYIYVIFNPG